MQLKDFSGFVFFFLFLSFYNLFANSIAVTFVTC